MKGQRMTKYTGQDGKTVLELLHESSTVQTEVHSGLGEKVVAIDGRTAGPDTAWVYTVDGKQTDLAAEELTTRDGQQVEWTLVSIH
jgi:hypothetical protein